jgi:transposase-like protein
VRFLLATRQVVTSFAGKKHWLWRAVDQDGFVLDVLVQSRRDKEAAKRLFRKLLKKQGRAPRVLITDKLKSYAAAKREIMPGSSIVSTRASITGPKTPINRPDDESGS